MRQVMLSFVLALAVCESAEAVVVYGISNGYGVPQDNMIFQINPSNGDLSGMMTIKLLGHSIFRSNALAAHPLTGQLYAVLQTEDLSDNEMARRLVTINPTTGLATLIGTLSDNFAGLTFRPNGSLIGVTGDGGMNAETLYDISTIDASSTELFPLGNGNNGEAVAMHPNGLLYHASGSGAGDEYFESVNLATQEILDIGNGSHDFAYDEAFALGYSRELGQMFLSDNRSDLYRIDVVTGATTFVGAMSDQLPHQGEKSPAVADNRGLAFVDIIPEPATGLLAVIGCVATMRRRQRDQAVRRRQD